MVFELVLQEMGQGDGVWRGAGIGLNLAHKFIICDDGDVVAEVILVVVFAVGRFGVGGAPHAVASLLFTAQARYLAKLSIRLPGDVHGEELFEVTDPLLHALTRFTLLPCRSRLACYSSDGNGHCSKKAGNNIRHLPTYQLPPPFQHHRQPIRHLPYSNLIKHQRFPLAHQIVAQFVGQNIRHVIKILSLRLPLPNQGQNHFGFRYTKARPERMAQQEIVGR